MSNLKEDIVKIIQAGAEAPSGDNGQPWSFVSSGNKIHIFGFLSQDPNAILERSTYSLYIAHGALIENMSIAADHFGYYTEVLLFPSKDNPFHTATIALCSDEVDHGVDLYRFIKPRVTDRNAYIEKPLTSAQKKEMNSVPSILGISARLVFIEDTKMIHQLARLVVTQVKFLFSHKYLHNEFYKLSGGQLLM